MLKLLKFEFQRKKMVFAVALILTFLAQIYSVYKVVSLEPGFRMHYGEEILGVFSGVLFVAAGLLFLIDIITLFRQDLFKQEGYMLFMTPNSGYKILGSKLIFALLEGLIIGVLYTAIVLFNIFIFNKLGTKVYLDLQIGLLTFEQMLTIGKVIFAGVLTLTEFAVTVYFSFAVFKSLFNSSRFKGVITFIIYVVINFLKLKVVGFTFEIYENSSRFQNMYLNASDFSMFNYVLNHYILLMVAFTMLFFFGTGYLLEKKINL